jgi:hypothetical protein
VLLVDVLGQRIGIEVALRGVGVDPVFDVGRLSGRRGGGGFRLRFSFHRGLGLRLGLSSWFLGGRRWALQVLHTFIRGWAFRGFLKFAGHGIDVGVGLGLDPFMELLVTIELVVRHLRGAVVEVLQAAIFLELCERYRLGSGLAERPGRLGKGGTQLAPEWLLTAASLRERWTRSAAPFPRPLLGKIVFYLGRLDRLLEGLLEDGVGGKAADTRVGDRTESRPHTWHLAAHFLKPMVGAYGSHERI